MDLHWPFPMKTSVIKRLAVSVLVSCTLAASFSPAEAQLRRPVASRAAQSVLSSELAAVRAQHGENIASFEILRHLYRYSANRYVGGMDAADRMYADLLARRQITRAQLSRALDKTVGRTNAAIRRTLPRELQGVSYLASHAEVTRAYEAFRARMIPVTTPPRAVPLMASSRRDPRLGPAVGETPSALDLKTAAKLGYDPVLHSAYGFDTTTVLNRTAALADLPEITPVACSTDADCRGFTDTTVATNRVAGLHAHCATGASDYDFDPKESTAADTSTAHLANVTEEAIGDPWGTSGIPWNYPGTCQYGPQYRAGTELVVNGRNFFDTWAGATLLRVADQNNAPLPYSSIRLVNGVPYAVPVSGVGGTPATNSSDYRFVANTQTDGKTANAYLTSLNLRTAFHDPGAPIASQFGDLWRIKLPNDLAPGLYQVKMLYTPAYLQQAFAASLPPQWIGWKFLSAANGGKGISNALYVRVNGDKRVDYFQASVWDGQSVENQDPAGGDDEVRARAGVYKLDMDTPCAELNTADLTPLETAQLVAGTKIGNEMAANYGIKTGCILRVKEYEAGDDDVDDGDMFTIGGAAFGQFSIADNTQVGLVMWELYDDDGDGVPAWAKDTVDALMQIFVAGVKYGAEEYGAKETFNYCTQGAGQWCGWVAAAIIVAKIAVEIAEVITPAEWLGASTTVYSRDDLRYLTQAKLFGVPTPTMRTWHENALALLTPARPIMSLMEFGDQSIEGSNSCDGSSFTVFQETSRINGESFPAWSPASLSMPKRYVEVRTVHQTTDACVDEDSTYAVGTVIESLGTK